MINLAGVVILYYPDVQKTIENIKSYSKGVKKLYVFDNSENRNVQLEQQLGQIGEHVVYHYFGQNEGISKRLNQAACKALEEGFGYLLTMDQDSNFPEGAFEQYIGLVAQNKLSHVAQYGVNSDPKHWPISEHPICVNSLITSGTIIDLFIYKDLGPFEEKLFIDFVDVEYSLRSIHKGYVNLVFLNIVMNHAIGFKKLGRSFKNFKKTPRILHSPIRVYYIVRNGFYLMFKLRYYDRQARIKIIFDHMKMLKNDFLYNDHLLQVYKLAFQGFFDFLRNKMGKK